MSGNAGIAARAAPWPDRGRFVACVVGGTLCLLALDLHFAPALFAQSAQVASSAPTIARAPSPRESPPRADTSPRSAITGVIARFDHDSHEPIDEAAIRGLATTMIAEHEASVALEGTVDRVKWVKARLVSLGVSGERIELLGRAPSQNDAATVDEVLIQWREPARGNEAGE